VTVPASIQQLLKKHNVAYSLADLPMSALAEIHHLTTCDSQQVARARLLRNKEHKKLLAITPSQTILDLQSINIALGDSYQPVTGDALTAITTRLGLTSMAAMPKIGNLPTIVDSQLLEQKTLLLETGLGKQLVQLDSASFQKLLSSTIICSISSPLKAVNEKKYDLAAISPSKDKEQIVSSISQFTQIRIKQRLEETLELPPLPVIAERIIQLHIDPNADVSDLCEVVELDGGLAAQVVSWAASPYYSAPGTIRSIHDAVVRVLGFDMVISLSLGLALGNTLKLPTYSPDGYLTYWQQSVYVAACTEALISCMPRDVRPSYGSSYLSGLLHNFGFLLIAEVYSEKFKDICAHIDANPHVPVHDIEQKIIGVDRDQLAAWLIDFWNIPTEISVALRHQSNPEYDGQHWEYSLLIYIAKKLLNERGISTGVSSEPVSDEILARFQLNRENALEAIDMILESEDMLQAIAKKMQP